MHSSDDRPGPPPAARPKPARPAPVSGVEDAGGQSSGVAKPVPVRQAAGAPETELPPPPTREFTADGQEWVAETAGAALAGEAGDAAAHLILIIFRQGQGEPEREACVPRRSLEELSELELLQVFESAVPFRTVDRPEPVFGETRRSGGRR